MSATRTSSKDTATLGATQTRARPAAIENVGRFITDSLLAPGALEDFFKGDVARPVDVRDAFDRSRRLWKKVVYRTVGENASAGVTRQAWTLQLLDILGHRPRLGEELESDRGTIKDLFVARPAESTSLQVVYDLVGFSDGLDSAVKGAEVRRTRHERLEDLLAHLDVPWGMIANGKEIRLLRKDTSGEPRYLQFQIESILEEEDQDAFWVFYQLLRWRSLVEQEGQPALLTRAIEESDKIGTGVSKALGESARGGLEVFLRELYRDKENQPYLRDLLRQPDQLEELHREGLLFLYRILFVFFAESRKLLPLDNPIYFESYSLEAWRDKLYHRDLFSPGDHYLWGALNGLFSLIESGFDSPLIRIPPYNGGLFAQHRTPILSRCQLNDQALRDVLFSLSTAKVGRTKKDQKSDRVSYRELGVEQLGSVYEGLLEFEPKLAAEDMVVVPVGSGKKASAQVMPRRELQRLKTKLPADPDTLETIPKDTLYLSAWGGRRKGSGSYYTPSVITRFLVEQALKPLVEPILERCASRDAEARPLGHPDEILRLRVIDPAMGSGAFLVAATHYLAEQYGKAFIAAGLDEDGQFSDIERGWYRRKVVEHCIYGVDLNPLAVELAKVSLWLTTLAGDRPLTFLDHHLRCGNSLIGAPIREFEVEREKGKTTVRTKVWIDRVPEEALAALGKTATKADKERAKQRIAQNRKILDDLAQYGRGQLFDIDQKVLTQRLDEYLSTRGLLEQDTDELALAEALKLIHEKERLLNEAYQKPESGARRLKLLSDLWCTVWFWPEDPDNPPPHTGELRQVAGRLLTAHLHADTERVEQILATAKGIAREQRFFHWELEFPEVYRVPGGGWAENPGFDAVVGNPPWDTVKPNSQEFFSEWDPTFRELGKQKALARMQALATVHPGLMERWARTERGFVQQSNVLRESGAFRNQGSGDVNTYKLFTERFWRLIRHHGQMSLLISSGLGSDLGSADLRRALFEEGEVDHWFALSNEKFIFPGVHHSFRFLLVGARKGGTTTEFPFLSRLDPREALDLSACESFLANPKPQSLVVDADTIRKLSPDSMALMGFRTARDVEIVRKLYAKFPPLVQKIEDLWNVQFATEFHMTNDSHLFRDREWLMGNGAREEKDGRWFGRKRQCYLPLLEGKHIYHLSRTEIPYNYWVERTEGLAALSGTNSAGGCDLHRVVWRSVAASTNERTLICTTISKDFFLGHSLSWIRAHEVGLDEFLAPTLSSIVFDFLVRLSTFTNLTFSIVGAVPVPRLRLSDPLLRSVLALQSDLPKDGYLESSAVLRGRLEAAVALCYGISADDLAYIFTTFPLLDRDQPALPGDLDLDAKPRSYITRDLALLEFFKLRGEQPPDDILPFFRDAGADITNLTGEIRNLEKRVAAALELGAIAYMPPRPSLRKGRAAEADDEDDAAEESAE